MLTSTLDLIQDALRKSGEKYDGTSDYQSDALVYMDTFYRSILSGGNEFDVNLGEPWVWAKAKYPGIITIQPPFSTGNITVTSGSSAAVLSSPPSFSLAGYIIHANDNSEFYRVVSHTAGNVNLTLDTTFNDPSGTYTVIAFLIDYDLSAANVLRQIGPMKVNRIQTKDGDQEGKVTGLDMRSFEKKYPLFQIKQGIPTEYGVLYKDPVAGLITIRVNKYSDIATKLEYDYIPVPAPLTYSASSIPVIPPEFIQCLSYATAFAIQTDKEDNKAKSTFELTKAKLQAMVNANRREFMQISKNRGRLIPRMDDYGAKNWPTSGW